MKPRKIVRIDVGGVKTHNGKIVRGWRWRCSKTHGIQRGPIVERQRYEQIGGIGIVGVPTHESAPHKGCEVT